MSNAISQIIQEDETARMKKLQKRILDHQKWKETWDAENQLQKMKLGIEQGLNAIKPTQYIMPLKPIERSIQEPLVKSRSSSVSHQREINSSGKNVFITSEAHDEKEQRYPTRPKEREEVTGDYPWENRERSREQYREIIKKT